MSVAATHVVSVRHISATSGASQPSGSTTILDALMGDSHVAEGGMNDCLPPASGAAVGVPVPAYKRARENFKKRHHENVSIVQLLSTVAAQQELMAARQQALTEATAEAAAAFTIADKMMKFIQNMQKVHSMAQQAAMIGKVPTQPVPPAAPPGLSLVPDPTHTDGGKADVNMSTGPSD